MRLFWRRMPLVHAVLVASACGVTDTDEPSPVESVVVTPSTLEVGAGATGALTAEVTGMGGTVLRDRKIVWASANPAIATVSDVGVVTGVSAGRVDVAATVEGKSGIAGRGLLRNGIVLHGGCPALRMRTASRGRVRPAVRVRYTRPPAIRLRDGVMSARARSICRRPSLRRLLATLRSPRSDMLDWTRFHGLFEHTRHGGHGEEKRR